MIANEAYLDGPGATDTFLGHIGPFPGLLSRGNVDI